MKAASLSARLFVIITPTCPNEVACNIMMLSQRAARFHRPEVRTYRISTQHLALLNKEPEDPPFIWST